MQRGLVNHRAGEKRIAVLFQRDGQAPKPVCPLGTQMALEPDLIGHEFMGVIFWIEFVWHSPVPVAAGANGLYHLLNIQGIYWLSGVDG